MKRFATAALLAALVAPAVAADVTLLSGFISRHSSPGYHESNHGIGIRIDSGDWAGYAIGTYRNSLDRQTVYVAKEWQWHVAGPLSVGVIAGGATGYRFAITPAVLPEVVLRVGRVEAALVVQPFELRESPAFVAAQLRYSF